MSYLSKVSFAVMVLLAALRAAPDSAALAGPAPAAVAKKGAATFSSDSVWFYRDGIRIVPQIGKRWLTVVFDQRYPSAGDGAESAEEGVIQKRAKALVKAHGRLVDYLYDPNLAEDACFVRMRDGLRPQEISGLIAQLKQDQGVRYVNPTVVLDNKTFAYFDTFEMEWKTGIPEAQRQPLLAASHVTLDETDEKGGRYRVNLGAIPFFRALNLLSEDIRVLSVTPRLVEIKPSISAKLSVAMSGGNIGDSIPFTLTIAFSDQVKIDPSSLATPNLRPADLQKELFDCTFDPYDFAKVVTKSPIVLTGRFRLYAPGEFILPPVKISYSCPSCPKSTVRSVETQPAVFKVSSLIPTTGSDNRLIVPTEPVSADFRLPDLHRQTVRYRWLTIILFAALVPCLAWLMVLLFKAGAARGRTSDRKREGRLADQLRTLLHETPEHPHWSYLGKVGSLLRDYLVAICGVDPKYRGGSARHFMENVAAALPPQCVAPLGDILADIDDSVSLESEEHEDIGQLQRELLRVVDLTAMRPSARG